jgi:hypothetical protein
MESLNHPTALSRRHFLQLAGLAGASWLTPLGQLLAEKAERSREPAQSVILLWMAGGPSQLDTFDPHPGTLIGGDTKAINTAVKGVQLAEGFGSLAVQMSSVSLIRSMVSKEGDHERGTYYMKTGYRPDPTVVHPSIGAICCHELPAGKTEIPRHISILPNQWPSRGGFFGAEFDAFQVYQPGEKLPDLEPHVAKDRDQQRLADLDVIDGAFRRGRVNPANDPLHREAMRRARVMMTSEQLAAFDIKREPESLVKSYGPTAFGRACLSARRLIEVGVRCVEVTLDGWDTHANNHVLQQKQVATLDPAFSTLLRDLREHRLLEKTIVLCLGEFGRTPKINAAGGRDHWPTGFSIALAGGGLRGGQVIGATDAKGGEEPEHPLTIADVHTTVLSALGLDVTKENITPAKRPIRLAAGKVIGELLN